MRRRFLIAATAALAAVATVATTAPAGAGSEAAASRRDAEHRRIVEFWTPERQARALPRDVGPAGPAQGAAKPGGSGSTSTTTGATWSGHPNVRRTTGKVFFRVGGLLYTCSGSAVEAPAGASIVSTAGHCVHDGNGGPFVTEWAFYPRWNGAADSGLGVWTAEKLYTTPLWANTANGWDDDAGFARVYNGSGKTLAVTIAAEGGAVQKVAFSSPATTYTALGYPAAKKYKGNTLTYCSGAARIGAYDGRDTLSMRCDMTGGSSGGPWLRDFDTTSGVGTQSSLNSYGYASLANVMFGPVFDGDEQAAYAAAGAGSCNSDSTVIENCAA